MKKNRPTRALAHSFTMLTLSCLLTLAAVSAVHSDEAWKTSFDDICSKVDASGTMSTQELSTLVERVNKLVPQIEASNEPAKKIYLQRLKKCRSMYQFMIDTKNDAGK